MSLLLLIEENFFRVDDFSTTHPQVFAFDFMIPKNSAIHKLNKFQGRVWELPNCNRFGQHCKLNKSTPRFKNN